MPGADTVAAMMAALPEGATRSYDPNIRPALLEGHRESVERFESLAQHMDVIKLSDEDAAWLYPDLNVDRVLDRVLSFGARLGVVTRGGDGMTLASQAGRVLVSAASITVADTIGAGDSAMGAIIDAVLDVDLSQLDETELHRIGSFAVKVAGITASRHGADPPWAAELKK